MYDCIIIAKIFVNNAVLSSGKDIHEHSMTLSMYKAVPSGGKDVPDNLSVMFSTCS